MWWSWAVMLSSSPEIKVLLAQLQWVLLESSTQLSTLIRDYSLDVALLPRLQIITKGHDLILDWFTSSDCSTQVKIPCSLVSCLDGFFHLQRSLQRWLSHSTESVLQLDFFLWFNFLFPREFINKPPATFCPRVYFSRKSISDKFHDGFFFSLIGAHLIIG